MTLRFETNEQIIDASATDRVPEVIFTYTDEAGTEVTRPAMVTSDTGTTNQSFVATYELDSLSDSEIESDVGFRIRLHDRSGNEKSFEVSDTESLSTEV